MRTRNLIIGALACCSVSVAVAQQSPGGAAAGQAVSGQRPAGVPFYTWVREDTFGGFIEDDMARFERGVQKTQQYLDENATNADAANWMAASRVYRAVQAFERGDAAAGDRIMQDALTAMDAAVAQAPNSLGIRATAGGTLAYFASRLPERHYKAALQKAREHYAALYAAQAPALAQFPLHIKGELLAGVAETEFRVGDRDKALTFLNKIVTEMPDTAYGQKAAAWLKSPERVDRDARLVCQSCHEPGRLKSWMARQPTGN
jgi:tetratricopeptide (TPR) repeat protein